MPMFRQSNVVRSIASMVVVAFCAFLLPWPAIAQPAEAAVDDCMQGKLDGKRDAKGNPLWILAGVGCGICGAGAAYLMKPNPPAEALLGKSSAYVLCYTEAYQSKARMMNTGYACAGWAAFVAVYAAAGGFETEE